MNTIYTAGYAGWTPEVLLAQARTVGAKIVDIRLNPTSRRPEWTKSSLLRTFGSWYGWEPMLGNINYANGGPIVLAQPDRALAHLAPWLTRQPILLLCQCREYRTCHRRVAADYLSERLGTSVVHLEPPIPPPPAGSMKALTVRQPWAWALLTEHIQRKTIENRSWSTRYRGRLAIHAAKGMTQREYRQAADFCAMNGLSLPPAHTLAFGCVLGMVDMVDCVDSASSPWFEGPYGFVFNEPKCFPTPIPAQGALGLWDWAIPEGIQL